MNKIISSSAALLICTGVAHAEVYKLDPAHTNARFNIDHFGTTTNHGGFYNISGDLDYNENNKGSTRLQVEIPVSSINTGNQKFDEHLKSPDLLNAKKFPVIAFSSSKFHFDSDGKVSAVDGTLTMLGKSNPVTLKASKFNCYESPMFKARVCGGDFTTDIDRTQWGVNFLTDMGMTKDVTLQIQVEAVKQK
ncbi:hypothetical protein D3C81_1501930 [compost metagenome]